MLLVPTCLQPSSLHGLGIFALENISAGTRIWDFTPGFDLRWTHEEILAFPASTRPFFRQYTWKSKKSGLYCFASDDGRFFNHSDSPNCLSEHPEDQPESVVVAIRDIAAGEELTDNYASFEDPGDL